MLKSFLLNTRPFTIFDPSSRNHRESYFKFQQTKSWKHSPVQWTIDDDSSDIVHCINKKLVDYYTSKEFIKKTTTPTKTVKKVVKKQRISAKNKLENA